MYRALVQVGDDGQVTLSEEELHHLVRVRRLQPGQLFRGLDGLGKEFRCRLERDQGRWWGKVEEVRTQRQPLLKMTLVQSLVKGDRFEWVLEKATELGVWEVVPIVTWRTEVRLGDRREQNKIARWNKIMLGAVKQSGQSRVPHLRRAVTLEAFLSEETISSTAFRLDEARGTCFRDLLSQHRGSRQSLLFVGPEDGWDDRDRAIFDRHGVTPVCLGPRVLRAETAAVAALSILQYELGDLCDETGSVHYSDRPLGRTSPP